MISEKRRVIIDRKDCSVVNITREMAIPFLMNVHYARRMPSISYAFGLMRGGVLVGCVTYGVPASHSLCIGVAGEDNSSNVLELNRLVICSNEHNDASFLVGNSLRMLPKGTFVVSYADNGSWGHVGYIYQATNFLFTGATKERTDIYSEGHSRHYEKGETRRKFRSSKYRYIYLVGDKRQKKVMRSQLRYKVFDEYPKGETRHYDTLHPTDRFGNRFEGPSGYYQKDLFTEYADYPKED